MKRTSLRLFVVGVLAFAVLAVALSATGRSLATPTGSAFPLKVSSNGRYLVDQNNVPFLMVGDSPQSAVGNLSESEADRYFADRQAHGFNTVWINLLCDGYTFCNSDGTTKDGIKPFTTGTSPSSYDLSTPNPAYFQRVDDIVKLAADHGLLVVLDPIETGGWLGTMQANGATKDFNYGAYLGSRYKSYPNIVWMSGNDFQSWGTSSDDTVVRSVARGIQSTDPNHLQTVELDYLVSSSLDDGNWSSIIGMNAAYSYYPTYAEVLHAYNQTPTMPAFMVEANYEFEDNTGDGGGTTQNLRRQEYWTMLSGATGQLYGSGYTDQIANGWSAANLDSVGVTQLGYMTALFQGRSWYNLVPDQSHTLVTAGYGTFSSNGSVTTNDYATAARTADGSLAMVYMPTARTVTVDMTQLGSNVAAQWYDPTNGSYATVNGSPFANTGSRQFTPPATNSGGDSDWVLVLTATGGPPPPPPPPPSILTIGETNVLPNFDNGNGNLLVAQSAVLSTTATLTSLSFDVTTAAGKLRLGVYDSSGPGGGPGALKAQTAEITPIPGWNTANVTSPVSLPAGTYWLAYFPSDNNLAFLKTADASSSGKYYSLAYGALPATFSTAPSSTPSHWSLYATLTTDSPAP
jgi:Protein of unknown function (DUF4038)/Putative collagen-binding domain of a collagenase